MSRRLGLRVRRAACYLGLALLAAITLTPLIWLVAASTKGPDDLFHYTFFAPGRELFTVAGISVRLPSVAVTNFTDLFAKQPFLRNMMNSLFVAGATVIVQLFFSSLAGFALAKYEFKGKRGVMLLMISTMLIPGQVVMAPMYALLYKLGLVDTHLGLIVPAAVSVFGIFLFRQSILQVPDELLHASRIDGCSEFRIYWDIVMPISRPMIGAFCLIGFMGSWNNFLWPQIILHSADKFTLPIALSQLVGLYQQQYGMLMSGTLLSILPVVALFLLLQREFVAGLTAGAVKG